MKIEYVEIDNRNEQYKAAIQSTLNYETFKNNVNRHSNCNYYKRKITISEIKNEIFSEVTKGRGDILHFRCNFTKGKPISEERSNNFRCKI